MENNPKTKTESITMPITQSIKNYLDMENIHSAIMLTGEWGCGKSFYVKNLLEDELNKLGNKIQKLYVSLYGLEKPEDINNAVKEQYLSPFGKTMEKTTKIENILNNIGNVVSDTKFDKFFQASKVLLSFSDIIKFQGIQSEIDGKKVLLVFDDFERSTIDIQVLMGVINEYAENSKVKVLVVANEDEIKAKEERLETEKNEESQETNENKKQDKKKTTYERTKEKFIFQTISFNVELKKQLKTVFSKLYPPKYREFLNGYLEDERFQITDKNLRNYIFVSEKYQKIHELIEKTQELEKLKEYELFFFDDFLEDCLNYKSNMYFKFSTPLWEYIKFNFYIEEEIKRYLLVTQEKMYDDKLQKALYYLRPIKKQKEDFLLNNDYETFESNCGIIREAIKDRKLEVEHLIVLFYLQFDFAFLGLNVDFNISANSIKSDDIDYGYLHKENTDKTYSDCVEKLKLNNKGKYEEIDKNIKDFVRIP